MTYMMTLQSQQSLRLKQLKSPSPPPPTPVVTSQLGEVTLTDESRTNTLFSLCIS